MKQIMCALTEEEYKLLKDILGHVGYDADEGKTMMSLNSKLLKPKIVKISFSGFSGYHKEELIKQINRDGTWIFNEEDIIL